MGFFDLSREEKKALKNRLKQKQIYHKGADAQRAASANQPSMERIRDDSFDDSGQNGQKRKTQTVEKLKEQSTSSTEQNSDNQAILVEIPLWALYLIGGITLLLLIATLIVFFQDGPVIIC